MIELTLPAESKQSPAQSQAIILEAMKSQKMVRLDLDPRIGFEQLDCYVLGLGEEYLAVEVIEEWHCDGVRIFHPGAIKNVEIDGRASKLDTILKWRGLSPTDAYQWLDLDNLSVLFESIKSRNLALTIEEEESIDIGRIIAVDEKSIVMKLFDAEGTWLADDFTFSFEEIFAIRLGNEYAVTLREFADAHC